ncbi:related to maackiain detoxification protein 1 [Fusarium proliferatum]|nr:related to maackiain detoxification protein 1 [Fusarium proliferatum]
MGTNNSHESSPPDGVSKDTKGHFVVVGAGYGGLAAAIELRLNGHDVEVIEATKTLTLKGDTLQLTSYSTRLMSRWGDVLQQAIDVAPVYPSMTYLNWKGEPILEAPMPPTIGGFPVLFPSRGLVQQLIYKYAVEIGVKFRFGYRVTEFIEEDDSAGVYVGGELLKADAVIGADGVHSKARQFVTGKTDAPRTSGGAVYRAYFDLDLLADDPLTKHLVEADKDLFLLWVGASIHIIVQTNRKLRKCTCLFTHREAATSGESWESLGSIPQAVQLLDGWDPVLAALVSHIPEDTFIDWTLLWRDPARPWVSPKGRMIISKSPPSMNTIIDMTNSRLVGDAAHPHIPSSGAGAAQATEDGATIAAMIEVTGIKDVPLALRATEKLRYERTSLTQRLGWENRHRWQQTDWDEVKKNPEFLRFPMPGWLYDADARKYAYDNAEAVIAHIKTGAPFISTNVPQGHVHQEWTMDEIVALFGSQKPEQAFLASEMPAATTKL